MLSSILVIWLATIVGLGLTSLIVPGIQIKSFSSLLISAIVLGLINVFLRPILWLLTAPLSVLTFGLFTLVINALMIKLAATMVPDFKVSGFGSALLAAIVMALIGVIGFVVLQMITGGTISWYSYEQHSQYY